MKKSLAAAGLLIALALGGCQPLEVDQVAQQSMIGLSKRDILACMGQPAQRVPSGQGTEIWTYTGGQMRGYGPQWAIGLNTKMFLNRPPGPPDEAAIAFVRPLVEKASLALCVNEAWAMLAFVAVIGLLLVPFARDRAGT